MARRPPPQRHLDVPTSNAPPIPEWAPAYWYMIRCAALQAGPVRDPDTGEVDVDATQEKAADLVAWFQSLRTVTPCPECRAHYRSDWESHPFTLTTASDPVLAMHWVEELRLRIEERKAAERREATGGVESVPVAATVGGLAPNPTPAQRRIAIQAAVKRTAANHSGCKFCGASKVRAKAPPHP